jgi:hypothetical protein
MIELKKGYEDHDRKARETLDAVFRFTNKKAAVIIDDVNYWTFGELLDDIPEQYYGDDPGVMMEYQLKKIERHYGCYEGSDCYQAFLMPWYGTAVLASGFGLPIVKNYKADPAAGLSAIKKPGELKALKSPDPEKDGLMPQVLKTLRYFKERCDLPVGVTDCQGPLTTALSVVGYDNFCYWMYDHPKVIHGLMDTVTDALIEWVRFQKRFASIPMESDSFPLGVRMPDGCGGVWMSDDDSVMIGGPQYREFVVPYNSRLLEAFGGGCVHYCGTATQHIESFLNTKGLRAINNLNLDNIPAAAEMKKALSSKGIVYMACDFVPNDSRLVPYYKELFSAMGNQRGLIVVSYVAPAIELEKGRYAESRRGQFELGKKVKRIIDEEMGRH